MLEADHVSGSRSSLPAPAMPRPVMHPNRAATRPPAAQTSPLMPTSTIPVEPDAPAVVAGVVLDLGVVVAHDVAKVRRPQAVVGVCRHQPSDASAMSTEWFSEQVRKCLRTPLSAACDTSPGLSPSSLQGFLNAGQVIDGYATHPRWPRSACARIRRSGRGSGSGCNGR
jgi:hypothetical protein